ncbi:MAG TPA: hypothetical protein VGC66_03670 [Pyrinomonadaceae bacterium]
MLDRPEFGLEKSRQGEFSRRNHLRLAGACLLFATERGGEKTYGWHYDLMLILMNLVIVCTNGGRYVLWK